VSAPIIRLRCGRPDAPFVEAWGACGGTVTLGADVVTVQVRRRASISPAGAHATIARVACLIAFPMRLDPTGAIATVEQNSDAEIEQQLALAMLTGPGERIQVPAFGCADPAFTGFELSNLRRHLATFGPEVDVVQVGRTAWGESRERVEIRWQRMGGDA
jgi:hypothetical protein